MTNSADPFSRVLLPSAFCLIEWSMVASLTVNVHTFLTHKQNHQAHRGGHMPSDKIHNRVTGSQSPPVYEISHWPDTLNMFSCCGVVPANCLKWCHCVRRTCSNVGSRRHKLRLLNFTWWQQWSEISGDCPAVMMSVCVRLHSEWRMTGFCFPHLPSPLTALHSIDTRLFYFQVSFLMNMQFIHWVGREGRGAGRATAMRKIERNQRGNSNYWIKKRWNKW